MPMSAFCRQVKNVARNYSAHQIKVREATSNDSWGPSKSTMCELAELTHSPMAFTQIMPIIWKRMNKTGKKWRQVYNSLVLLEYLVKAGHDMVVEECAENFYLIDTLKDFQYIEKNEDLGMTVRETAKKVCSLLSDNELLSKERKSFKEMRNKFMNSVAVVGESRGGTPENLDDISLGIDNDCNLSFSTTNEKAHRGIDDLLTLGGAELANEIINPITSSSTEFTKSVIDKSRAIHTQNDDNSSIDYFCMNSTPCAMERSSKALADLNTLDLSAFVSTVASGQHFNIDRRDIFSPISYPTIDNSHCSPTTANAHLSPTKIGAENFSVDTENLVDLNNLIERSDFYLKGGVTACKGANRNPFKTHHRKLPTLDEMRAAGFRQSTPM